MKDSGVKGVSIFQLWVHLKDLVHPENHVWICDHRGDKNLITVLQLNMLFGVEQINFIGLFLKKRMWILNLKNWCLGYYIQVW